MDTKQQLLEILKNLEDEWPEMFGEEVGEVHQLLQASSQVQDNDLSFIIDSLLEKINNHPNARERLKYYFSTDELLYDPTPGGSGPIEAGTLMVCPIDPTHYRMRLRQKGQRLICPAHDVELVPEINEE